VTAPRRRLADRLIDSGRLVAQNYADQDRLDPARPPLAVLVAETLADHERIGEERVLTRAREIIAQRAKLRDERIRFARGNIDAGLYAKAASELSWAAALDDQIDALQLLLTEPAEEPT
jgi:hypothetical protein